MTEQAVEEVKGPIPGTFVLKSDESLDKLKGLLADVQKAHKILAGMSESQMKLIGVAGVKRDRLKARMNKLQAICDYQAEAKTKGMRVLRLDKKAKRRIVHSTYPKIEFEVPLVWVAKIPTSGTIRKSIFVTGYGNYDVKSKVPGPTDEVRKAIKKYNNKFDRLEVWWVPNNFKVVKQEPPVKDPVLVGVIKIEREEYYYELVRWIDKKVEDPYYTREAY